LSNAAEARKVVFDLFQDLEDFNLEDYKPFADVSASMDRLIRFLSTALEEKKQPLCGLAMASTSYAMTRRESFSLHNHREVAREQESLDLMGLDHPMMQRVIERWQNVVPEELGTSVSGDDE
jgi:hypothetical protein